MRVLKNAFSQFTGNDPVFSLVTLTALAALAAVGVAFLVS